MGEGYRDWHSGGFDMQDMPAFLTFDLSVAILTKRGLGVT